MRTRIFQLRSWTKKIKIEEKTTMDVHKVMSTTEVIITSIAGPAGVIIYFLLKKKKI
ncbi:MAG TPA: hypothetical protein VN377_01785 [Candidatus Thermoplasmatota archaeon]|nr:hypothetical protein [Candidatus Thermoplasmatota archaeon]